MFVAHSDNVVHSKDQTAENILSSIEPAQVKNIVKKVADEVLGNFQVVIIAEPCWKTTVRLEQYIEWRINFYLQSSFFNLSQSHLLICLKARYFPQVSLSETQHNSKVFLNPLKGEISPCPMKVLLISFFFLCYIRLKLRYGLRKERQRWLLRLESYNQDSRTNLVLQILESVHITWKT